MHIGIDASRLHNINTKTGVEWYSTHLIPGLCTTALKDNHRVTLYSPHPLEDIPGVEQCILPAKRLWHMIRLPAHFTHKQLHPDVFFVPSHILPPLCPTPAVTTIHDVAFYHYPHYYSTAQRLLLEYGVRRARHLGGPVLTVSESTKRDLIAHYRIPEERITVTPLGFQGRPTPSTDSAPILQEYALQSQRYFLYLGRIEDKKNCTGLIQAFLQAHLPSDAVLVLAGKTGRGGEKLLQQYAHHPQIRFTDYIDDETVAHLLHHCVALTIPSFYEGFCMPILEAYHAGKPVLTSHHSSMPEVAGPGALLVDPFDLHQIQNGLTTLWRDEDLRQRLASLGHTHSTSFTWERTIKSTYQVLINTVSSTPTKTSPQRTK